MTSSIFLFKRAHSAINLIRKASFLIMAIQLSACATRHVQNDTDLIPTKSGSAALDSAITSQAMDFTPQGSDSHKIKGLTSVHFAFDKSTVAKSEFALVTQNVAWMKSHPGLKIQIEGNCDSRGSVEYNLALGERRAKVVYEALKEMGIETSRLSIISFGKERPLDQGDTDEAYAQNRRVNFVPINAPANTLSSNDIR
jgi:peptidoglycan-associated lipoprotein